VIRYAIIVGAALAACTALPALAQDAAGPGNAANGERAFAICRACHQIGPTAKNAVGPVLNGVVGRKAGTYPGYNYSEANKNSGLTWTPEELQKYLAGPQKVVPGTKMIFPGFPHDPQKVNDVIAFLGQYGEDGQKKTP
jgi:cytochrome c